MPWYGGESLLEHLEAAPAGNGLADGPARLPVQYVIRADGEPLVRGPPGRRHAARSATRSSSCRPGTRSRIAAFEDGGDTAAAPRSIAVALEDELDVGRGDLLARPAEAPEPVRELTATVCWLGDTPARPGARYLIKHTTRSVTARLEAIEHRLDVTTLEHEPADELELNAIGRVRLRLARAAHARPVRARPRDRRVHRRRRGDERHGRRRHGRLTPRFATWKTVRVADRTRPRRRPRRKGGTQDRRRTPAARAQLAPRRPPHRPLPSDWALLLCDGGSRGNPGPAAVAAVLLAPGGAVLQTASEAIGRATAAEAEYRAILLGLELADRQRRRPDRGQERLAARDRGGRAQGAGRRRPRGARPCRSARSRAGFSAVRWRWHSRGDNEAADALVRRLLWQTESGPARGPMIADRPDPPSD